jgi:hypothetical protein
MSVLNPQDVAEWKRLQAINSDIYELLLALDEFFSARHPVYPGALIFDSDTETVAMRVKTLIGGLNDSH